MNQFRICIKKKILNQLGSIIPLLNIQKLFQVFWNNVYCIMYYIHIFGDVCVLDQEGGPLPSPAMCEIM
jgi:hypothetical protein